MLRTFSSCIRRVVDVDFVATNWPSVLVWVLEIVFAFLCLQRYFVKQVKKRLCGRIFFFKHGKNIQFKNYPYVFVPLSLDPASLWYWSTLPASCTASWQSAQILSGASAVIASVAAAGTKPLPRCHKHTVSFGLFMWFVIDATNVDNYQPHSLSSQSKWLEWGNIRNGSTDLQQTKNLNRRISHNFWKC